MGFRKIVLAAGVACVSTTAGFARAQEASVAATPVASATASDGGRASSDSRAGEGGHASGFMVQARVQTQTSLLSLGAGSGFVVGYQGPSYALGLGLGLTRIGISSGSDSASLTLFQIAPTAIVDIWHSKDGRARANLVGSVGYSRASVSSSARYQSCSNDTCATTSGDVTASASLIPVQLGFGGDYFLSRNFALGAEFGLQALFLVGLNASSSSSSSSGSSSQGVDAGANAQLGYGALRATIVLGD